ncbi:hypothetical protein EDC01DRAFT_635351 [Geopyxis carbonaria]|nr:hypothetical protein EDC01DRAFT_635351 [Geopyxis carbonaria]
MIMHKLLDNIMFLYAMIFSLLPGWFHVSQVHLGGNSDLVSENLHRLVAGKPQENSNKFFLTIVAPTILVALTLLRASSVPIDNLCTHVWRSEDPEIAPYPSKLPIEEWLLRDGPYTKTESQIAENLESMVSSTSPGNKILDEEVTASSEKIFTSSSYNKEPCVEILLGLTCVDKLFPSVADATLAIFPVRINDRATSERASNERYESHERVRIFLSSPERPWAETVESELAQSELGVQQPESEPQPDTQQQPETRVERIGKFLEDFDQKFSMEGGGDTTS